MKRKALERTSRKILRKALESIGKASIISFRAFVDRSASCKINICGFLLLLTADLWIRQRDTSERALIKILWAQEQLVIGSSSKHFCSILLLQRSRRS